MQEYISIDQTIHQLSQIITKFNRTFVPKKEDDSHTNLSFDALEHRLFGRWVENGKQKVILALHVDTFEFQFIHFNRTVLKQIPIQGKTQQELENAVEAFLPEIGLKPDGFKDPLHFEIPDYGLGDKPYQKWESTALEKWVEYRSLANRASSLLLGALQLNDEIRIWPHHFDTGIYVEATDSIGLGFGLAIQDDMVGEPYFYFSGYGLNGHSIDYSATKPLSVGKWITTENWNGAVLPYSELSEEVTRRYLREVLNWYIH